MSDSSFDVKKKEQSFDEKFIYAYMGNGADKIYLNVKNGGFNIWAILFGICYYVYRKMYLVTVIMIAIQIGISLVFSELNSIVGICVGFMFCPLYKWDITRKLRKIKQENLGKSEEELLLLAKKKGGTSIASVFILVGGYLILLLGLVFILGGG